MGTVTGDSTLQTGVLEDLADAVRYRRWLADLARPYLGDHPVEIGSGTGAYALEWAPSVSAFTATEADESRFAALSQRFADHPVIRTRYLLLGAKNPTPTEDQDPENSGESKGKPELYSGSVAFNVLEHIPDHVGALRAMGELVRPGGAVVIVVPAFPSAMSRFDLAIGHQRRYTRQSLGAALTAAGLEIEQLRYVNPVGLINWYLAVKVLRMTPRNGAALRLFDRTVVPVARALDRFAVPFGQSVFAVGRVS